MVRGAAWRGVGHALRSVGGSSPRPMNSPRLESPCSSTRHGMPQPRLAVLKGASLSLRGPPSCPLVLSKASTSRTT